MQIDILVGEIKPFVSGTISITKDEAGCIGLEILFGEDNHVLVLWFKEPRELHGFINRLVAKARWQVPL